jgi:hypothetical protein
VSHNHTNVAATIATTTTAHIQARPAEGQATIAVGRAAMAVATAFGVGGAVTTTDPMARIPRIRRAYHPHCRETPAITLAARRDDTTGTKEPVRAPISTMTTPSGRTGHR